MLFENKNPSLRQLWNLLPGKMTAQIFIMLSRDGGGWGLPFPFPTVAGSRGQAMWAPPESLLFGFYGSSLNQLVCMERREGVVFNPSLVASLGSLFLFCPRLEICIEASFVELLEGLCSKCIACIGEQKLQVWESNGKELTVLLGSIHKEYGLPSQLC